MYELKPILHRNGSVTYWSVYNQVWVRHALSMPLLELLAIPQPYRKRVFKHFAKS